MKTSVILDAMDQSKTNIPHFQGWRPPKVRIMVPHVYSRGKCHQAVEPFKLVLI